MLKKGQEAIEFIMTYGWAILLILAIIGAIAYFGTIDECVILPEKCAENNNAPIIKNITCEITPNVNTIILVEKKQIYQYQDCRHEQEGILICHEEQTK